MISKWIFQRIFIVIVSRRVIVIWLLNEVGRGPGIFWSRSWRSLTTLMILNKGTSVNILICYLEVHGVMGHKSLVGSETSVSLIILLKLIERKRVKVIIQDHIMLCLEVLRLWRY